MLSTVVPLWASFEGYTLKILNHRGCKWQAVNGEVPCKKSFVLNNRWTRFYHRGNYLSTSLATNALRQLLISLYPHSLQKILVSYLPAASLNYLQWMNQFYISKAEKTSSSSEVTITVNISISSRVWLDEECFTLFSSIKWQCYKIWH